MEGSEEQGRGVEGWMGRGVDGTSTHRPFHSSTHRPFHPSAFFAQTAIVPVTNVRVERTATGLDIILETQDGKPLTVDASKFRTEGNNLIADIPNAVLTLPQGNEFRTDEQFSAGGGVTGVQVTQVDGATLRVTVAGRDALPTGDVTLKTGGLAYSLNPEADEPDEEIVVTGEGQRGYRVPNTSTGTRTDTPLRDIPQSIQVVPQAVLRDQQVTRIEDALRNVPGVTLASPLTNRGSIFTIRGFTNNSRQNYLRNGYRDIFGGETSDLSNIERIEVLKGPASVLFGQGVPGGTINFITKQPLPNPFYNIEATIGSYDFYRGAVDLSGPLNDSKTVLYRLNAAYRNRGSFTDFFENEQLLIAPVLSWAISEKTTLTLEGQYLDASLTAVPGLPAIGTIFSNPNGQIPRNRFTGEPDGDVNQTIGGIGYRLEHRFSNSWSLRNAFQATFYRDDTDGTAFQTSFAPNRRILNRTAIKDSLNYINTYDLTTDLTGKFSTGLIQHQLLFGVDLRRVDNFEASQLTATAAPLDVFNPVYGRSPGRFTLSLDAPNVLDALGIYIQDQVTLAENLKLLLGVRFDAFEQTTENRLRNTVQNQSGDSFSPRVGLVYQPIPAISLYASYSRSFNPAIGVAFNGETFQPERGTQYEVGVKADLSNRLSATLAFYDLARSNVLTTDPNNVGFSIQTGEQRSRGIEFNISGEILPGWNIIAGYAYTDTEIVSDNVFRPRNQLNNSPENAFNLWTTYEFQKGFLQGFGVGLGFFFVGDRQGDLANTFELPSYFRTDAAIFYRRGQFRAALNLKNLFNVDYFEAALTSNRVFYGDPFTVQGTISWQF